MNIATGNEADMLILYSQTCEHCVTNATELKSNILTLYSQSCEHSINNATASYCIVS